MLLAAVDANYSFTMVDVGAHGRQSDGGVFSNSVFGGLLERDELPIPGISKLPGSDTETPFCFVYDEAFPLKPTGMRPYAGKNLALEERIFNYRLSRARRVVENTFGICVAQFRVLLNVIDATPDHAELIVKACIALHNYLRATDASAPPSSKYIPPFFADYEDEDNVWQPGDWRKLVSDGQSLRLNSSNNYSKVSASVREAFKRYFLNEGCVSWQEKVVNRA